MLTKTILLARDLQDLVAGVFEYNQRGPVVALGFFSEDGQALPVAWIEVAADDAGLRVRTRPEPTPDEQVAAMAVSGM